MRIFRLAANWFLVIAIIIPLIVYEIFKILMTKRGKRFKLLKELAKEVKDEFIMTPRLWTGELWPFQRKK